MRQRTAGGGGEQEQEHTTKRRRTRCCHRSSIMCGVYPVLQDFKRVLASPGRILDGLALQYAVMPPLALLTARLLNLSAPYTIGCAALSHAANCIRLALAAAFGALRSDVLPATDVTPSSCCAGCAWWHAALAGAQLAS